MTNEEPVAQPCTIALGLGCDRGTAADVIAFAVNMALSRIGATSAQVKAVASISLKADEVGLLALAAEQGWAIRFYTPEQLAAVPVPNPSETVRKYTGSPSVSEAAALLAGANVLGHTRPLPMSTLLVEKFKHRGADGRNATVSIARCDSFPIS